MNVLHFLTPLQKSLLEECLKDHQKNGQGISITGVPGQYDYKTAKSLEDRGLITIKNGQEVDWDTVAYFTNDQAFTYRSIEADEKNGRHDAQ